MVGKYIDLLAELLKYRNDVSFLEWRVKYSLSLKRYKDIHDGEDCFIIGNGPSLNEIDLNKLNDYTTFGLNKIYLMFDKVNFRPSYHVAVNPLVIEQSFKEFESLSCPTFISYRAGRRVVRKLDHVNFLMTGGHLRFSEDIVREIHEGWTVTFVAMQLAYYMGFKNIFLVGVDHNFVVNGHPNEQQFLFGNDSNHFDPRYFGGQEWHLPDLEGSEIAYSLAKFFFERNSRRIYDATLNGKLKIFPKVSFNDSLMSCKKRGQKDK